MNPELLEDVVRQVLSEMKLESSKMVDIYNYGIFDSVDDAINASEIAQRQLFECSVQKRNEYANAIRQIILKKDNLEMMSRDAVEETGIGRYEDKILKNKLAAEKTLT